MAKIDFFSLPSSLPLFSDIMSNLHDQIKTLDRQVNEGGEFIKAVKKNTGRIEVMEARERRKNLIIKGLRQERRLERPNHLEGILKRFFKQTLNVTAAKFEEVTILNFSFFFVSVSAFFVDNYRQDHFADYGYYHCVVSQNAVIYTPSSLRKKERFAPP